jgi:hypothetical protein
MTYQLAEALHMTPSDILDRHTAAEYLGWHYYFRWQKYQREQDEKEAERKQNATQAAQDAQRKLRGRRG